MRTRFVETVGNGRDGGGPKHDPSRREKTPMVRCDREGSLGVSSPRGRGDGRARRFVARNGRKEVAWEHTTGRKRYGNGRGVVKRADSNV